VLPLVYEMSDNGGSAAMLVVNQTAYPVAVTGVQAFHGHISYYPKRCTARSQNLSPAQSGHTV
jgi:hypothetical protein